MVFDILWESSQRGELILVEGGYCRFHLRKDGQLTIYEIISQNKGVGSRMLSLLKDKCPNAIFAKCPVALSSNSWYEKNGFVLQGTVNNINHWKLTLNSS